MIWDNKNTELEFHIPDYDESVYIGISWDKVKDNETGLQFKERVVSEINKILGVKLNIEDLTTHKETR